MSKHEQDSRAEALEDAYGRAIENDEFAPKASRKRRLKIPGNSPRTRSVVLAAGVLAVTISPFAVAATGDALREGRRNGTTTRETEIVSNIKSSTSQKGGYATRQSNLSTSGGGAIYGCRSQAGGSAAKPTPQNPCIRANNLSRGYAFEFNAQNGDVGGLFSVGAGGDGKKPFTTNATGVATGLNADRLDGAELTGILGASAADASNKANAAKNRWLLVNAAGEIEAQSGGFTIAACYPAAPAAATGNCYINAGEDLSNNGITTTIALQNQVNQGGGTANGTNTGGDGVAPTPGDNLEFSGEIAATRCGIDGVVICAPTGTNNANHLVVSPRLSTGERTTADSRKRFYVQVTG